MHMGEYIVLLLFTGKVIFISPAATLVDLTVWLNASINFPYTCRLPIHSNIQPINSIRFIKEDIPVG